MAKKKKTKKKVIRRARVKQPAKQLTLADLDKLAKRGTLTQPQLKRLWELQREQAEAPKSIKERLEAVQEEMLDAVMNEMRKGKGIALIKAIEMLRAWSREESVGRSTDEGETIEFMTPPCEEGIVIEEAKEDSA